MSAVLALAPTRSRLITLTEQAAAKIVAYPSTASVVYTVGTNGLVSISSSAPSTYQWLLGGLASDYEVMFDTNSGVPTSGTADAWLPMTSNRSVSVGQVGIGGPVIFNFDVKIGLVGTSTAIATATVNLYAEVYDEGGG